MEELFLPYLVLELEIKKKKKKLPPPPAIGRHPFLDMRLSCDGSPEIVVRRMLDYRANIPVILQTLVETYKIPRVLRSLVHGIVTFDGKLTQSNARQAYTQSCTLRVGSYHMRESFEIAPLQDDRDIL